jgi:hypothetical protein
VGTSFSINLTRGRSARALTAAAAMRIAHPLWVGHTDNYRLSRLLLPMTGRMRDQVECETIGAPLSAALTSVRQNRVRPWFLGASSFVLPFLVLGSWSAATRTPGRFRPLMVNRRCSQGTREQAPRRTNYKEQSTND